MRLLVFSWEFHLLTWKTKLEIIGLPREIELVCFGVGLTWGLCTCSNTELCAQLLLFRDSFTVHLAGHVLWVLLPRPAKYWATASHVTS